MNLKAKLIPLLILSFVLQIVVLAQTPADFIIGPQVPPSTSWFDTTQIARARVHGQACPVTPPTDADGLNSFILLNYYDLPLNLYIVHKRTGSAEFLTLARRCADAWWQHPQWIKSGAQRDFDNGQGPPPRHAGIGGLILRALDGRPEMWDWITVYTRHQFNLWLKRRINNSELYYGAREGAFMLHYATWIAATHPDAAVRAELLAEAENVAVNYFGRLQQADGSWRWGTAPDEFLDTDGGTLKGITQPFMIGLLLNALIDLHRLSTNATAKANVANQITRSCRHLYLNGPYRTTEIPGLTGKRWRDPWYFYHGGTSVNPTKYEKGGGSYTDALARNDDCGISPSCTVGIGRQAISTIFAAYGYAYLITGDPFFKTAGDELFDAAFVGTDGFRGMADTTAKNFNQNYYFGGRYLAWRGDAPTTPTPSPTPTPVPSPTPTPLPSPSPTPAPTPAPSPSPLPTPMLPRVVVRSLSSNNIKREQEINQIEQNEGMKLISCSSNVCNFARRP